MFACCFCSFLFAFVLKKDSPQSKYLLHVGGLFIHGLSLSQACKTSLAQSLTIKDYGQN